jgi:hypothetical protein
MFSTLGMGVLVHALQLHFQQMQPNLRVKNLAQTTFRSPSISFHAPWGNIQQ